MPLTREEIAALLDGITPGEWRWFTYNVYGLMQLQGEAGDGVDTSSPETPDARLMAAAPILARQLLAEMDARQVAEKERNDERQRGDYWKAEAFNRMDRIVAMEREREWQPIETALRESEALLLRAGSVIEVRCWGDYCKHNHPRFTHWMPLPAPPSQVLSPQPEPEAPHG